MGADEDICRRAGDVRAPVTSEALTEGVWRRPNMEGADRGQVVQHALTEGCHAPTEDVGR